MKRLLMPKTRYNIEVQFINKKWEYVNQTLRLRYAYDYIARRNSHDYPFRIVRVVKTIVFREKKS